MLLALVLSSSGCAGIVIAARRSHEDTKMQSWMYHPVEQVVTAWGPPSRQMQLASGKSIWEWDWNGGAQVTPDGFGGATISEDSCREWFEVATSSEIPTIVGWHRQGC
jgi:hypothetical protein